MLKAGYEYASEDMLARKIGEARVEAEALLAGLQAALAADGDLLFAEETTELQRDMTALETVMEQNEPDDIRAATEVLGRASEVFAARRMDRSIQAALQGVALTDLESAEAEENTP
jgi:molecular chaperone HscA